jgi:hypothetical protein
MRVLDLGCGPGTITTGLAAAVVPGGLVLGVDLSFAQLVVAARRPGWPWGSLMRCRVLRPGGLFALSSSDWSAADIHPHTAAVDTALHAYWTLRQRTGTDPFVGRRLAGLCRAAGCTVLAERASPRVDLGYTELAAYLRDRLTVASDDHPDLVAGVQAGPGHFIQCWIEVLAT